MKNENLNLEEFLKENGFELDTYYHTNKRFCKAITEQQNLYVRIFSDINTIQDVEYEHIALDKFEKGGIISFDTVDNIHKLNLLIKALK